MPPVGPDREKFHHFTKAQLASYRQGFRTYKRAVQKNVKLADLTFEQFLATKDVSASSFYRAEKRFRDQENERKKPKGKSGRQPIPLPEEKMKSVAKDFWKAGIFINPRMLYNKMVEDGDFAASDVSLSTFTRRMRAIGFDLVDSRILMEQQEAERKNADAARQYGFMSVADKEEKEEEEGKVVDESKTTFVGAVGPAGGPGMPLSSTSTSSSSSSSLSSFSSSSSSPRGVGGALGHS